MPAQIFLFKKMKESNFVNNMKNKYDFDINKFYKHTSQPIINAPIIFSNEYVSLTKIADERMNVINNIYNSIS